MFDYLLESSRRDDSNKWLNLGFSEEIDLIETKIRTLSGALGLHDKVFISIMPISSPNPMFDHLLESSQRDDSNKWSNIGFTDEITQVVPI